MKKHVSFIAVLLLLTLTACGTYSVSKLDFSFKTSIPTDSYDEKSIFLNENIDKLKLDVELRIDSGNAAVSIINMKDKEVIWSGNYVENTNFQIELENLKAGDSYLIAVQTAKTKDVKISITSDTKLVLDEDMPDKPDRQEKK